MRTIKTILFCVCLMIAMADASRAQGWRNIVPLHSTREDVKRILGPSGTPKERLYDLYDLPDEVAFIMYSGGPCKEGAYSGWNVPRNTVININVAPKTGVRVADLHLDEQRYKKRMNHHAGGIVYYANEKEGSTVEVSGGRVMKIYYYPAMKDDHLRCPDNPRGVPVEESGTTQSYDKIDAYGDIPFEKEKERLDHLTLQLLNMPDMRGFIIAYAGRRARAGEARARAECAKNYLVNERGIEAGRIVTMDGGHREEFTVDLYLVPHGAVGPTATPTVDPGEVQIIKPDSARHGRRSTRPRCKR